MGFKEIDDTGFAFLPQRLFLHSLCVCVCVHMCGGTWMCLCSCMQMCVEARGSCIFTVFTLIFETEPGAHDSDKTSRQGTPEIPLFPPLTFCQLYSTGARTQTQVSMLAPQALYRVGHSPAPNTVLFNANLK